MTTSLLRIPATATVLTWLKRRSPCCGQDAAGKLQHFQRAAQIDVQAGFFGFAVQRSGNVQNGVSLPDQPDIVALMQAELRQSDIAQKNL